MTFFANHQDKRLCEVVFPGSHDAGINSGRWNVQTQTATLGQQMQAGARFFDIRVAARKSGSGASATYEMKTYHLKDKLVKDRKVKAAVGTISTHQTLRNLGGWGESLDSILIQARQFVTNPANHTEFVILKFSKCFNWKYIADACISILDPRPIPGMPGPMNQSVHYKGGGNLNTKKVSDLAGKVVTIFPGDAYGEIEAHCYGKRPHGLLYFKELYQKGGAHIPYQPNPPSYVNMQYFGKFSSTSSIKKNTTLQRQTLMQNSGSHPDCVGMMYWTTTGNVGNILKRNRKMWSGKGRASLQKVWNAGLEASINDRLSGGYGELTQGDFLLDYDIEKRVRINSFMPNIVMMDDVDAGKCNTIQQLNDIPAWELWSMLPP